MVCDLQLCLGRETKKLFSIFYIYSGGNSGRLYIVEDVSTAANVNPHKKFLVRLYGGKLVEKNDIIKAGKCETSEGMYRQFETEQIIISTDDIVG